MNLLILKGFNNYFNRIIKKYTTLSDYTSHSDSSYDFSNINFNPNDGVTTTQVIGNTSQQQTGGPDPVPLAWEHDGNPDYLIAYETEQVGNATVNTIKSRWFIVESVRTRNGQYSLKLKRDSIADFLESLLSCPAFIKKGTVSDDNPLIVNDEGITVNQIKSRELLLKDESGSAWIVGYMAKNAPASGFTEQLPAIENIPYETIEDIASETGVTPADLSNALTDDPINPSYFVNDSIELVGWLNLPDNTSLEYKCVAGSSNNLTSFNYSNVKSKSHSQVSDCFAKVPYSFSPISVLNEEVGFWLTSQGSSLWKTAANTYISTIKNNWSSYTTHPFFTKTLFNKLQSLANNKTLIYKSGKYYLVKIGTSTGPTPVEKPFSAIAGVGRNICQKWITDANNYLSTHNYDWTITDLNRGQLYISYNELVVNFYLEEASVTDGLPGLTVKMSSTRNVLQSQPYDMFAIPANNMTLSDGLNEYPIIGDYAQSIAMKLIEKLTNANVYDIQLLPYCPIQTIVNNHIIDVANLTDEVDYDLIESSAPQKTIQRTNENTTSVGTEGGYIYAYYQEDTNISPTDFIDLYEVEPITWEQDLVVDGTLTYSTSVVNGKIRINAKIKISRTMNPPYDEVVWNIGYSYKGTTPEPRSIIIYPKTNSFSVSLNYNLTLKDSMKIDSQTDLYRLVSPNYQGSFDFNVAKNGGAVNGFIADCTYKPYTPYIKVCPNFAWLYGTNFGDCRGLICGGDFSIGFLQDAWENYQLNNKNYQNIFNREIQNLDVNQSIQRTQQYLSGGLNIVRDTIAGGVGGGVATGSPYGAIAGAVIGGAGSGIGYGVDMNLMEKGLQEQRQFAIDKFKMQLGNIQALPYTLTKVGAFNINSKVWPFLEYYTCSEQEKEALKMKIQYEGMTVGIVDVLGNYMSNGYVQADLIRNEAIIEDSHLLDDIYIELTKGVYM